MLDFYDLKRIPHIAIGKALNINSEEVSNLDNNQQIVFKTSAFGGFEKKAVLDYIYSLNEENLLAQIQLSERIEALSAADAARAEELRLQNEKLEAALKEIESARAELSRERSHALELDKINEWSKGEISRQHKLLEETQNENKRLQLEYEELYKKNQNLQERQEELNQTISSVGKLMVDARNNADNIVDQAKSEAAKTIDDANVASQLQIGKAREEAARIIEEAKEKADLLVEQSKLTTQEASENFDIFCKKTSEIRDVVAGMLESYKDECESLIRIVQSSSNALDRAKGAVNISADLELEDDEGALHESDNETPPKADEKTTHGENFFRAAAGIK